MYHTNKTPNVYNKLILDNKLPLNDAPPESTYSNPLPLWRQTPKPKGQSAGLQRMSRALRYDEQAGTRRHHHLTLSSVLTNPLWLAMSLKRSRSELGQVLPVMLLGCLAEDLTRRQTRGAAE